MVAYNFQSHLNTISGYEVLKNTGDLKLCWVGSARYTDPLDATSRKKFQALKELGELYVVGVSKDLIPRCFTEHATFYLLPQIPVHIIRYLELYYFVPILSLWLIFVKKVSIFIVQGPYEGVPVAVAKIIAGFFGRRVVVVVENHNDFEETLFMQRRILFSGVYRFLMRCAATFSFNQADMLRPVSNTTRQQVEAWCPGRPVFQFVAWTDMEVFLSVGRNRTDYTSKTVNYTGVLIPRKGVVNLINAFAVVLKDIPDAGLVIIGKEENREYTLKLKVRAVELGIAERVSFMPDMPQDELAQKMGEAAVFVLPSLSEALGRVVVEAMAAGTPAIGANVGGIPEMVKEGETGFLVEPEDENALAGKIKWFLMNPEKTRIMGRNSHVFAESFFSTKQFIDWHREMFACAKKILGHK